MPMNTAFETLMSENYTSFILTIGCITVGNYFYDKGRFKIFDSHAKNIYGHSHPQGTCVLVEVLFKSKMAKLRESHLVTVVPPDIQDVQFLSDRYDALVESKTSLEEDLGRFSLRLDLLEKRFDRIN